MGYTIQYGPAVRVEKQWYKTRKKTGRRLIAAVTVLTVCATAVLCAGAERVRDFLIPGDPEVTRAAFSRFTENVRSGESFGDALAAFCVEIVESAEEVQ